MKLWSLRPETNEPPAVETIQGAVRVTAGGIEPLDDAQAGLAGDPHQLLIVPLESHRTHLAVAMIPATSLLPVSLDNRPLGEGLHPLDHASRLDIGRDRELMLWLAADTLVEEVDYDPAVHGETVYCARTNLRITEGRIVLCPGGNCDAIFSADAWALQLPCPRCRYDSTAGDWEPPAVDRAGNGLQNLLALVGD